MCSLNTVVIFLLCFLCLSIIDEASEIKLDQRSEVIFERFIENYLNILSTAFTGKELIRYCRMMSNELRKMNFRYTDRLAKRFRRLSRKHRDDIVDEMAKYKRHYDEKPPRQQEFLSAMDQAFTLQQGLQFDDYIHDLLSFGKGHMLFVSIQAKSRNILDMILECVDDMGRNDRKNLEKVMKLAIREYTSAH